MNRSKELTKGRVAVGLSGGVDSAVSAHLLKNQGYEVVGVHVVCWDEGPECKAREDRKDALGVALALRIPFEVLDFQKEYKERVIERFYEDYGKGLTPNPDILCNSEIKFGLFLNWAEQQNFDYMATGHYAKAKKTDAKVKLVIPKDKHKDQTYFLHRLSSLQLSKVLFPLSELFKDEVREIARKVDLPVANKKDSQGICFMGDVDVQEFLRRRLKEKEGEVVDTKGRVVGKHKGVWFYTIGQRGGWEVSTEYQKKFSGEIPVFYVIEKNVTSNQLVVGFGAETYREKFEVHDLSWIGDGAAGENIRVRIRHGGELLEAKVGVLGEKMEVELMDPQRGVSPGQAAVFYKEKSGEMECLGGGTIQ